MEFTKITDLSKEEKDRVIQIMTTMFSRNISLVEDPAFGVYDCIPYVRIEDYAFKFELKEGN